MSLVKTGIGHHHNPLDVLQASVLDAPDEASTRSRFPP